MKLFQRWKQTALHNKALVLTGAIVALGTLLSTAAVITQVILFRENSRKTGEQIDKLIAAANVQAGAADSFSASASAINKEAYRAVGQFGNIADSAYRTVQDARESFRQQQRPYIWAKPRGAIQDPNDHSKWIVFLPRADNSGYDFGVVIEITNQGRSPANMVVSKTNYIIGPTKGVLEQLRSYKPAYRPGGYLGTGIGETPVSDVGFVGNEDFGHLKDGSWALIVLGGVKYSDASTPENTRTRPYETLYCFQIKMAGLPFGNCPPEAGYFHESIK